MSELLKVGTPVRIRESCLNEDGYEIIWDRHKGLVGRIETVCSHDYYMREPTYRVAFDVPCPRSDGGFDANAGFMPARCFDVLEGSSSAFEKHEKPGDAKRMAIVRDVYETLVANTETFSGTCARDALYLIGAIAQGGMIHVARNSSLCVTLRGVDGGPGLPLTHPAWNYIEDKKWF